MLPGIAFSLDLIETTHEYGLAEVLVSSFMAAFIFSIFGAQPLTIAGVTGMAVYLAPTSYDANSWGPLLIVISLGPITVFNKTIFDILNREANPPNYHHFIGWVYLWAAIIHWVSAILNCQLIFASKALRNFVDAHVVCSSRVQFSQICYPILLRHVRILRLLGLPSIWHPGPHSPVLQHRT